MQLPFGANPRNDGVNEVLIESGKTLKLTLTPSTFDGGRSGFSVTGFPTEGQYRMIDNTVFLVKPPTHASKKDPMHELSDNSVQKRAEALSGMLLLNQEQGTHEPPSSDIVFILSDLYFNLLYKGEETLLLSRNSSAIFPNPDPSFSLVEGGPHFEQNASWLLLTRADFWQSSIPKMAKTISPWMLIDAERWKETGGYTQNTPRGPRRNLNLKPNCSEVIYSRSIPELGESLSYQMISVEDHLELFAKWQNSDRVHSGWRQRSEDMKEHEQFIQECIKAPDRWGMIGYWGNEPWGYVEIYWVKESNVAPFYRCGPYDMGFHALVGEERFRGGHRVRTWMGAAVHVSQLPRQRLRQSCRRHVSQADKRLSNVFSPATNRSSASRWIHVPNSS